MGLSQDVSVGITLPSAGLVPMEDDPWALPDLVPTGKPWADMSGRERLRSACITLLKLITLLGLLYLFICSLDFLSDSFRLIGGRTASQVFSNSELLKNPVVGLMMGCLVTVLVQSSSTSTSIIVSMVSSGLLQVRSCVPMIMGANIGTSITNTLVSLTQVSDRNEFRRAFGGATVHDMFNWLSVITLLTVEVTVQSFNPSGQGYLEYMTDTILNSTRLQQSKGTKLKLLKVITKPFTSLVVKIDKKVLNGWALNDTKYYNVSLMKHWCTYQHQPVDNSTTLADGGLERCHSLFSYTDLKDLYVGLILLVVALIMLCGCLILMVKLLHTMLKGTMAVVIRKTLNANIPYMPWLTGYLAILVGCGMTILVQSSSVFTSAMTPLVGVGVISLDRMYPLTLGSNIGTTTTAILAALTSSGKSLRPAIQIALVHFFFNISGILIFYVVPWMRWPIPMARALGNITADFRWFAVAYLVGMFLVLPSVIFGLSVAGPAVLYAALGLAAATLAIVAVITFLQRRCPSCLPTPLRSWHCLPECMRSLQPYDRMISSLHCCRADSVQQEKRRAQSQFRQGHDNPVIELHEAQPPLYRKANTEE